MTSIGGGKRPSSLRAESGHRVGSAYQARSSVGEDRRIGVHVRAHLRLHAGRAGTAPATVHDLAAGSGIDFEPAGSRTLKGVDDPVQIYSVGAAPIG